MKVHLQEYEIISLFEIICNNKSSYAEIYNLTKFHLQDPAITNIQPMLLCQEFIVIE